MSEDTKKLLLGFFSKYPIKKYKRGETVLKPGANFGGICFAKTGYIKVSIVSKDGKETCIQLFKPLFYLSLISQLTNSKNKHQLEAITNVEYYVCPKVDFMNFLDKNQKLKSDVLELFLNKFMEVVTNMVQIIANDAEIKILSLIYSLANEFGAKKDSKTVIKFKVTHKLLASLTGLTRETATLQMLKLHKQKLIEAEKRHIVIPDMKKISLILGY
ncbi:MAG: Crp/Fnr family transcriptional regulator [Candidatus Shapirobacteria bacterium]